MRSTIVLLLGIFSFSFFVFLFSVGIRLVAHPSCAANTLAAGKNYGHLDNLAISNRPQPVNRLEQM
jgi:hypothetical protein